MTNMRYAIIIIISTIKIPSSPVVASEQTQHPSPRCARSCQGSSAHQPSFKVMLIMTWLWSWSGCCKMSSFNLIPTLAISSRNSEFWKTHSMIVTKTGKCIEYWYFWCFWYLPHSQCATTTQDGTIQAVRFPDPLVSWGTWLPPKPPGQKSRSDTADKRELASGSPSALSPSPDVNVFKHRFRLWVGIYWKLLLIYWSHF